MIGDSLIALRIIYLLVKPFTSFDAYKLGLIDDSGKKLKKATTAEEKRATSMLLRFVWNIKRLINLVPGGSSKIGSLAAAYLLVKEATELEMSEQEANAFFMENFDSYLTKEFEGRHLVEEAFIVLEDAPANVTGEKVATDIPTGKPRKFGSFKVSDKTFKKFKSGKNKTSRVATFLDLTNESEKRIFDFIYLNPGALIALQDSEENLKALRVNNQLTESVEIDVYDFPE